MMTRDEACVKQILNHIGNNMNDPLTRSHIQTYWLVLDLVLLQIQMSATLFRIQLLRYKRFCMTVPYCPDEKWSQNQNSLTP